MGKFRYGVARAIADGKRWPISYQLKAHLNGSPRGTVIAHPSKLGVQNLEKRIDSCLELLLIHRRKVTLHAQLQANNLCGHLRLSLTT